MEPFDLTTYYSNQEALPKDIEALDHPIHMPGRGYYKFGKRIWCACYAIMSLTGASFQQVRRTINKKRGAILNAPVIGVTDGEMLHTIRQLGGKVEVVRDWHYKYIGEHPYMWEFYKKEADPKGVYIASTDDHVFLFTGNGFSMDNFSAALTKFPTRHLGAQLHAVYRAIP